MVLKLETFRFYTWNENNLEHFDTQGEIKAIDPMAALEKVVHQYGNSEELYAADIRCTTLFGRVKAVFLSQSATVILEDTLPKGTIDRRGNGLYLLVKKNVKAKSHF